MRQLVRFGFVGLLNTAFGYGLFAALVVAGVPPTIAISVATLTGALFNFHTSRRFVFAAPGRLWRFFALYGVVWATNLLLMSALRSAGLPSLVAQALLVLPLAALSYVGQRTFVFQGPHNISKDEKAIGR